MKDNLVNKLLYQWPKHGHQALQDNQYEVVQRKWSPKLAYFIDNCLFENRGKIQDKPQAIDGEMDEYMENGGQPNSLSLEYTVLLYRDKP